MMRTGLIGLLLLSCLGAGRSAQAAVSECGLYRLKGTLRRILVPSDQIVFVVNEGTQAEVHFSIPDPSDFQKIAAHLNQSVEMLATLRSPILQMQGRIYGLSEVHLRVPDALRDQGYVQVKPASASCERSH